VSCFVSSGRQLLPILQATRNCDGTAPQAKLDELIKAHGDARDAPVGLKRKGENQIQDMWLDSAEEHVLKAVPGTFPTVCGAGRASAQAHSHQNPIRPGPTARPERFVRTSLPEWATPEPIRRQTTASGPQTLAA